MDTTKELGDSDLICSPASQQMTLASGTFNRDLRDLQLQDQSPQMCETKEASQRSDKELNHLETTSIQSRFGKHNIVHHNSSIMEHSHSRTLDSNQRNKQHQHQNLSTGISREHHNLTPLLKTSIHETMDYQIPSQNQNPDEIKTYPIVLAQTLDQNHQLITEKLLTSDINKTPGEQDFQKLKSAEFEDKELFRFDIFNQNESIELNENELENTVNDLKTNAISTRHWNIKNNHNPDCEHQSADEGLLNINYPSLRNWDTNVNTINIIESGVESVNFDATKQNPSSKSTPISCELVQKAHDINETTPQTSVFAGDTQEPQVDSTCPLSFELKESVVSKERLRNISDKTIPVPKLKCNHISTGHKNVKYAEMRPIVLDEKTCEHDFKHIEHLLLIHKDNNQCQEVNIEMKNILEGDLKTNEFSNINLKIERNVDKNVCCTEQRNDTVHQRFQIQLKQERTESIQSQQSVNSSLNLDLNCQTFPVAELRREKFTAENAHNQPIINSSNVESNEQIHQDTLHVTHVNTVFNVKNCPNEMVSDTQQSQAVAFNYSGQSQHRNSVNGSQFQTGPQTTYKSLELQKLTNERYCETAHQNLRISNIRTMEFHAQGNQLKFNTGKVLDTKNAGCVTNIPLTDVSCSIDQCSSPLEYISEFYHCTEGYDISQEDNFNNSVNTFHVKTSNIHPSVSKYLDEKDNSVSGGSNNQFANITMNNQISRISDPENRQKNNACRNLFLQEDNGLERYSTNTEEPHGLSTSFQRKKSSLWPSDQSNLNQRTFLSDQRIKSEMLEITDKKCSWEKLELNGSKYFKGKQVQEDEFGSGTNPIETQPRIEQKTEYLKENKFSQSNLRSMDGNSQHFVADSSSRASNQNENINHQMINQSNNFAQLTLLSEEERIKKYKNIDFPAGYEINFTNAIKFSNHSQIIPIVDPEETHKERIKHSKQRHSKNKIPSIISTLSRSLKSGSSFANTSEKAARSSETSRHSSSCGGTKLQQLDSILSNTSRYFRSSTTNSKCSSLEFFLDRQVQRMSYEHVS